MVLKWSNELSQDGKKNFNLMNFAVKKELKLDYCMTMDVRSNLSLRDDFYFIPKDTFQAGMIFSKNLSYCKSEYEYSLKSKTRVETKGLIFDLLDETNSEPTMNFFKTLLRDQSQTKIEIDDYQKVFKKASNHLKIQLQGLTKETLMPMIGNMVLEKYHLNGVIIRRDAINIKKKKKLFMVENVFKARSVTVSWRKDGIEGTQTFENQIIGFQYSKMKINEKGMVWMEDLSRKN